MKYKIILTFFIIFFSFSSVQASTHNERSPLIEQKIEIIKQEIFVLQTLISNMRLRHEISSPSYIAVNLSNNSVLLERNSNKPYSIASITKLMSAVVASEKIDLNNTIVLRNEMLRPWGRSPALFAGLNVSAKNLLKASIIQSTNDAAEALAHFLGRKRFVELMNQKAMEIGMANTILYDAHGLNPANRSTAQDLVKLISYIRDNHPEILTMTRNNDFWLPDPSGKLLKFRNMNNFHHLSSFIGGKTGFLPQAGQTMASIFNLGGDPIAVIVLQSQNRQADIFAILRKINN